MRAISTAEASTPGSIGNVGPGLDVLGAAVQGPVDTVRAWWQDAPGIHIADPGDPALPGDPARNAAGIAARAVLDAAAARGIIVPHGVVLSVHKGLPLAAGQGGSAASAVAGAAAVNALLGGPLDAHALLAAALASESTVAGRHLDNIAPSLLGGIVLVRSLDPIDVVALPVPADLRVVLASPGQALRTADARAVLPREVPRAVVIHQMAHVAAMVAALYRGDLALLGRALDDQLAEPARATLLPGFAQARRAALAAGALGASISGAGPTAFALCAGDDVPPLVADAMRRAYAAAGVTAQVRLTRIDTTGTIVRTTAA